MGIYLAVRDGFKKTKTKFILGCAFDIISSLILISCFIWKDCRFV